MNEIHVHEQVDGTKPAASHLDCSPDLSLHNKVEWNVVGGSKQRYSLHATI